MLSRRSLLLGAGAVAAASAVPAAVAAAPGVPWPEPFCVVTQMSGMKIVRMYCRLFNEAGLDSTTCAVELRNERGQRYAYCTDDVEHAKFLRDVLKHKKSLTIEVKELDEHGHGQLLTERTRTTGVNDGFEEG